MENRRGLGNPKIDGIECNYVFMMQWLLGGEKKKARTTEELFIEYRTTVVWGKKSKKDPLLSSIKLLE